MNLTARMEQPQLPGVKVGKPSSEASFDPLIALKVVTLTTTKSAVFGALGFGHNFPDSWSFAKAVQKWAIAKGPVSCANNWPFSSRLTWSCCLAERHCGFCSTGRVFSIAWGFSPSGGFWFCTVVDIFFEAETWQPWTCSGVEDGKFSNGSPGSLWDGKLGSCVAIWCDLCCLGLPGLQAFKDSAVQVSDASMTMVLRNFLPRKEVEVSEGYGSWRLSLLGYLVLFGIYITK